MDGSRHWLASRSTERLKRMLQPHRNFFREGVIYIVPAIFWQAIAGSGGGEADMRTDGRSVGGGRI